MRRADRLFEIVQLLRRASGPMTADAIAAELETSRRSVYRDVAASGKTKFVIVSRVIGHREPLQNGTAYDESLFLVKAVLLSSSATQAVQAAARIDVLLDDRVGGHVLVLLVAVRRSG